MEFLIFLFMMLSAIISFFRKKYTKFDDNGKIVSKAIMIYFGLAITALSVFATVSFVLDAAEEIKNKQLPSRIRFIEYSAKEHDYKWMADLMEFDMDYEEEFECYWERVIMHEVTMRYRIYAAAAERGMGEKYEIKAKEYDDQMEKYCREPSYSQNIPYAEYFRELAEKD